MNSERENFNSRWGGRRGGNSGGRGGGGGGILGYSPPLYDTLSHATSVWYLSQNKLGWSNQQNARSLPNWITQSWSVQGLLAIKVR